MSEVAAAELIIPVQVVTETMQALVHTVQQAAATEPIDKTNTAVESVVLDREET
jgi:predicted nucleic acid-binding protein